jgi:hypothetical protein
MPMIPDIINSAFKLRSMPCASKVPLKPNTLNKTLITTKIAALVARKRKIRIMLKTFIVKLDRKYYGGAINEFNPLAVLIYRKVYLWRVWR